MFCHECDLYIVGEEMGLYRSQREHQWIEVQNMRTAWTMKKRLFWSSMRKKFKDFEFSIERKSY